MCYHVTAQNNSVENVVQLRLDAPLEMLVGIIFQLCLMHSCYLCLQSEKRFFYKSVKVISICFNVIIID